MNDASSRREFLRWSAGFSAMGALGPFALQMTAAGSAAAAVNTDYKALVCLFLQGGQDSNNLVLATDADSWSRYTLARNTGDSIALMPPGTAPVVAPAGTRLNQPKYWGGVLPIVPRTPQPIPAGTSATERTFALHPMLAPLMPLWNQGRLAVLANVGALMQPTTREQFERKLVPIPPALASHNDQQTFWQTGAIDDGTGWGGRLGDILANQNGANPIFTALSVSGNATFVSGRQVSQYQVNTDGAPGIVINGTSGSLFGAKDGGAAYADIIRTTSSTSNLANDVGDMVRRSMAAAGTLNSKFTSSTVQGVLQPPPFNEPIQGLADRNPWSPQLHTIAQMVAIGMALGLKRQVFFAAVNAFDTHDGQNPREATNLAALSQAMVYFDNALANIGGVDMRPNVTTFTASDFSRTFTSNGAGTDHAWGGHHLIMGGAVRGGDMYGQYPTIGIDRSGFQNPNFAGENMIPTTSVDQYAATLGRWFGVPDSDLFTILPNLGTYQTATTSPFLGFV